MATAREKNGKEVAPEIYIWLKMCVVDGKSYNVLQSYGVPCGKEYFYNRYRLFFYKLNRVKYIS